MVAKILKKIKAVFFILLFLWILVAQGKQGADSLGLWRKAGWNWPLCRPQAIGLCTTFSGLMCSYKFNFHLFKAGRGCRGSRTQLSLPGRAAQPSPHCSPCLYNAEQKWLKLEMFENSTCPGADGCALTTAPQFLGRKRGQHKFWDLLSRWRHQTHLQSLVLVEPPWRYGLEKLLQPKRPCHSLEKKRDLIFKGLFQQIKS